VQLDSVPLFKSERAAQFLDEASANAVTDAVAELSMQHGSPVLIIIDTMARNFGAGDENQIKDMSEFVVAVDDLKAKFPGCSVLIVHHTGHADKQRGGGSIALKGALDAEYRIEKDGDNMQVINTKMKDAPLAPDLFFALRDIQLNGSAKSAVLEATDAPERKDRLSPMQKLAKVTYETAAVESGVWDDGGAFRGVHVEDWRTAFYAKHTGDSAEAKKKAFQRARKAMADAGKVKVQDDVYLLIDPAIQIAIMLLRDERDIVGQNGKRLGGEAGSSGTSWTNA
jgi:hypothetical protein